MRSPSLPKSADNVARPWGLSWRSHTLFIVSTVIVAIFSETFLYGIVIPVLPFMLEDRIGITRGDLQRYSSMLLSAYAGSAMISSPIVGITTDWQSSRKMSFLLGLVILITATILFFTGDSITLLVIARCAQGASSAFIWTAGLSLCIDTVGSKNLGKTLGTIMSFNYLGALSAPPLGGMAYSQAGILGVASLATAILLLDFIMRILLIEKRVAARYAPTAQASDIDYREESSPTEESPLLGSVKVGDDYFIASTENRFFRAMPILLCLGDSSLIAAIVLCGVQWVILSAFEATITLEAKDLFGFTSLEAGMLFIPIGSVRLVAGPLAGYLIDHFGSKPISMFGYAFLTPVLLLYRLLRGEPRVQQIALYCVLLALTGIGTAITDAPSYLEVGVVAAKYSKRNPTLFGEGGSTASVYGLGNMAAYLGMTYGPFLAGSLRDSIGYGNMNTVLAGIACMSAIASFIWLGGKPATLWKKSA